MLTGGVQRVDDRNSYSATSKCTIMQTCSAICNHGMRVLRHSRLLLAVLACATGTPAVEMQLYLHIPDKRRNSVCNSFAVRAMEHRGAVTAQLRKAQIWGDYLSAPESGGEER